MMTTMIGMMTTVWKGEGLVTSLVEVKVRIKVDSAKSGMKPTLDVLHGKMSILKVSVGGKTHLVMATVVKDHFGETIPDA